MENLAEVYVNIESFYIHILHIFILSPEVICKVWYYIFFITFYIFFFLYYTCYYRIQFLTKTILSHKDFVILNKC